MEMSKEDRDVLQARADKLLTDMITGKRVTAKDVMQLVEDLEKATAQMDKEAILFHSVGAHGAREAFLEKLHSNQSTGVIEVNREPATKYSIEHVAFEAAVRWCDAHAYTWDGTPEAYAAQARAVYKAVLKD